MTNQIKPVVVLHGEAEAYVVRLDTVTKTADLLCWIGFLTDWGNTQFFQPASGKYTSPLSWELNLDEMRRLKGLTICGVEYVFAKPLLKESRPSSDFLWANLPLVNPRFLKGTAEEAFELYNRGEAIGCSVPNSYATHPNYVLMDDKAWRVKLRRERTVPGYPKSDFFVLDETATEEGEV